MKFKLKDQIEVLVRDGAQFHARALRAIGQDLSNLFPQSLEITVEGTTFQVVGRYVRRDAGEQGTQRDNHLLGRLRNKFVRDALVVPPVESATDSISFNRTYTSADIRGIDEARSSHRNGPDTTPDIYSLGEILRMVGRIVDSDGKRLHKLFRDNYGVSFEYEDGTGAIKKRELSSLQLYKLQQQYYGERGTYLPIDNWKGSI
jgi:hypothetical protein